MCSYRNFFIRFPVIVFSFCFISCSDVLFPEFKVENVSYDDNKVTVKFSAEVDGDSAKKAISLQEDDTEITGTFFCSGNKISFFPKDGIRKNYDYDLAITTLCEDSKGISLEKDFHYSFSTRAEHTRPEIISISPANQQHIEDELEYISIVFSKPVTRESFIDSLEISPAFEYFLDFKDDDKEVHLVPKAPLTLNTDYTITVNTGLSDFSRNNLMEDKKSVFFYKKKNDFASCAVSVYDKADTLLATLGANENKRNISTDCSIRFDFGHKMDFSAASAYFYFTPSVDYKITKDEINGKYIIFELSNAKWNTEYNVTILNGLPDVYGQRYEDIKSFAFTTDNEKNAPPCFVNGIVQTSDWSSQTLSETDDFCYLSEDKNYSNISFSEYYAAGTGKKAEAYLSFYSSNESEGIDVYSLREGLSVSATNSCCQIIIKTINRIELDGIPEKIKVLFGEDFFGVSKKVSIFNVIFEITNTSKSGEIHFVLENVIKDSLNNSLERKYDFILNK